jgi:hypothetical protein
MNMAGSFQVSNVPVGGGAAFLDGAKSHIQTPRSFIRSTSESAHHRCKTWNFEWRRIVKMRTIDQTGSQALCDIFAAESRGIVKHAYVLCGAGGGDRLVGRRFH